MDEEASASFLQIAAKKGWTVEKSIGRQDYDEHWDYRLTKNAVSYRVDLKARKRINSTDLNTSDDLLLIELQGVRNFANKSRPGWLYGLAEYICFETERSFLFVQRTKLLEYIESVIDTTLTPLESNQNKTSHIIYTRKERYDKFVYISLSEILQLEPIAWRKNV